MVASPTAAARLLTEEILSSCFSCHSQWSRRAAVGYFRMPPGVASGGVHAFAPRRRCAAPLRGTSISPKGSPVGKDVASPPLRGSTARDKYLPQGVPCGKRCCLAAAARLHCEGQVSPPRGPLWEKMLPRRRCAAPLRGTSISPKGSPVGKDVASPPLRGSTARDKYLPQGVPCGKRCCLAAAA